MWIMRTPGLRLEQVGEAWLSFSAVSGETHTLNDEAAAVLDLLADGPRTDAQLAGLLSEETGLAASEIQSTLAEVWSRLEAAGLVCRLARLPGT